MRSAALTAEATSDARSSLVTGTLNAEINRLLSVSDSVPDRPDMSATALICSVVIGSTDANPLPSLRSRQSW